MASSVAASSLVSWTLAPAITTPSGPPAASTKRLRFTPRLPRSVGLGPMRSPQPRLAHCRIGRLPLPVHAAQLVALRDQAGPHAVEHAQGNPALQGAVHRAVVGQVVGQMVPLAATSQAQDD